MKLVLILVILASSVALAKDDSFERSRFESNPNLGFSSSAVRLFLDNLQAPVVRVLPDAVTWIEYPHKVSYCEAKSPYLVVKPLADKSGSGDDSLSILSVETSKDKIPENAKAQLRAGYPVAPINVNCLIGGNKKSLIFLQISADASFLVDLVVKKNVKMSDLINQPAPASNSSLIASNTPIEYELKYYRKVAKTDSKSLYKVLKQQGRL